MVGWCVQTLRHTISQNDNIWPPVRPAESKPRVLSCGLPVLGSWKGPQREKPCHRVHRYAVFPVVCSCVRTRRVLYPPRGSCEDVVQKGRWWRHSQSRPRASSRGHHFTDCFYAIRIISETITHLACHLATDQLLSLTALIAQLARHRPKRFDVGVPGCARNQAVIVLTRVYLLS